MDIKSGKELNYWQLLKHTEFTEDWRKSSSKQFWSISWWQQRDSEMYRYYISYSSTRGTVQYRKDATYRSFQCNIHPKNKESDWTRLTVSGKRINYSGKVGTLTTKFLLIKIMFNRIILNPDAKFMTIGTSNFYFNTPMKIYEYLKLKLSYIPS